MAKKAPGGIPQPTSGGGFTQTPQPGGGGPSFGQLGADRAATPWGQASQGFGQQQAALAQQRPSTPFGQGAPSPFGQDKAALTQQSLAGGPQANYAGAAGAGGAPMKSRGMPPSPNFGGLQQQGGMPGQSQNAMAALQAGGAPRMGGKSPAQIPNYGSAPPGAGFQMSPGGPQMMQAMDKQRMAAAALRGGTPAG